ncbi:adenine phosphoribosyltransferase [Pseudochryseolinea flava]|uniref:Adenine phosphoribosyltransferase n=1 Tax=Pseudochryseolinea flava TaxID=2059302 RepID=A0A364XVR2_9BACT|nr:adenine phosphoribosyltransferase [Pseudochryseolinea flava]RAV98398.1 adenine phosphoribosyltransferase [Pseudochryseolinea flava]
MSLQEQIKSTIRDINDYPKAGIVFKDITPVLATPKLVKAIASELRAQFENEKIDAIAATEARGFIFGSILALELGCAFIPIRKKGKLPYATRSQEYQLEYGTASVEIHTDAVKPGARVLIHDDLLATGGTAGAAADLIKSFDGVVAGFSFIINLSFLPGEENLMQRYGVKPHYLVKY